MYLPCMGSDLDVEKLDRRRAEWIVSKPPSGPPPCGTESDTVKAGPTLWELDS